MSVQTINLLKVRLSILTLGLLFVSQGCSKAKKDIPNPLLTENQMIDILYDLTIVDAIRMNNPAVLTENRVSTSKYIFEKHQIDSITFAENNKYYATKFDVYLRLYDSIYKRLDFEKNQTDSLVKSKKNNPENLSIEIDTVAVKKKGLSRVAKNIKE